MTRDAYTIALDELSEAIKNIGRASKSSDQTQSMGYIPPPVPGPSPDQPLPSPIPSPQPSDPAQFSPLLIFPIVNAIITLIGLFVKKPAPGPNPTPGPSPIDPLTSPIVEAILKLIELFRKK